MFLWKIKYSLNYRSSHISDIPIHICYLFISQFTKLEDLKKDGETEKWKWEKEGEGEWRTNVPYSESYEHEKWTKKNTAKTYLVASSSLFPIFLYLSSFLSVYVTKNQCKQEKN